jgi:hypothetical protein
MTDDELQARLRRLAQPGREPDWDAMAADVRAAYERELRNPHSVIRRRRWIALPTTALALAAAFALYVKLHHHPLPTLPIDDEAATLVDEPDPDELIDDLTPAQLDRVADALKKGA